MTVTKLTDINEALIKLEKTGWLPKAQVRILAALNRARGPINRHDIAERADVPETHVIGFTLTQYASKSHPTLVDLGLVSVTEQTDETGTQKMFRITTTGRQALARCRKES